MAPVQGRHHRRRRAPARQDPGARHRHPQGHPGLGPAGRAAPRRVRARAGGPGRLRVLPRPLRPQVRHRRRLVHQRGRAARMYGNFDVVLDHFTRFYFILFYLPALSSPTPPPHAPCSLRYVAPMAIGGADWCLQSRDGMHALPSHVFQASSSTWPSARSCGSAG